MNRRIPDYYLFGLAVAFLVLALVGMQSYGKLKFPVKHLVFASVYFNPILALFSGWKLCRSEKSLWLFGCALLSTIGTVIWIYTVCSWLKS